MTAKISFFRRTPLEEEVFGGKVLIEIDGEKQGELGESELTFELEEGEHTVKMCKTHGSGMFIGFAELTFELEPGYHLFLRYYPPMITSQDGSITIQNFDTVNPDKEAENNDALLSKELNDLEEREKQTKKKNSPLLTIAVIVAMAIIFFIIGASRSNYFG